MGGILPGTMGMSASPFPDMDTVVGTVKDAVSARRRHPLE
jgi:hypothetical protein